MLKVGDKVQIVDLDYTGLEVYKDYYKGQFGEIVMIDGNEGNLPYLVELSNIKLQGKPISFNFNKFNLVIVGEDDVLE